MRSLGPRLRAALPPVFAAVGIAIAAPGCDPARANAPRDEIKTNTGTGAPEPQSEPPSELQSEPPPAAVTNSLPFLDWVVSHCHIDELVPSAYTFAWHRYRRPADLLGPEDPLPLRAGRALPREGSAAAKEQSGALRRAWIDNPRSHVIDCALPIKGHRCLGCPIETVAHTYYAAYLPRALFVAPETVRSALFLVPGGNGGRSRPFTRPIPDRSVYDRGSGGLDTKRRADAFYEAHPGASQAIIVALETSGFEAPSGPIEHLSRTMPGHIAATFLPHLGEGDLVVGAEGVSSGAREILRAAFHDPRAFHTVGLSCMACGGVHPKTSRLAGPSELRAFADTLAARRREGSFDVRFAIGSRDGQLPCNKAYRDLFLERGVLSSADADAFFVVEGEKHDFNFLRRAYPSQLDWHLAALARIARQTKASPPSR
jgi:hypothetical protein